MARSSSALRSAGIVAIAAVLAGATACGDSSRTNDRWVTTQNAQVDIDWDAVGKAYKEAEGPKDFEEKVNEIYTGSEVISVAVEDKDAKTQVVTGFFDKDKNGKVEEPERVFTIQRDIEGDKGSYQVHGHGHYAGYHSPMWNIATGMAMGYMVSRAFSPSYAPVYRQPYVTGADRRSALVSHRDGYRQKHPDKFKKATPTRSGSKSKSGRSYGRKGGGFGGGRSTPAPRPRAGGRFGVRRSARPAMTLRLEA